MARQDRSATSPTSSAWRTAIAPTPVNIGNPLEMTIKEFAEHIIRMSGVNPGIINKPLPSNDPKLRRPDITKAQTLLSWQPKVSFEKASATRWNTSRSSCRTIINALDQNYIA